MDFIKVIPMDGNLSAVTIRTKEAFYEDVSLYIAYVCFDNNTFSLRM